MRIHSIQVEQFGQIEQMRMFRKSTPPKVGEVLQIRPCHTKHGMRNVKCIAIRQEGGVEIFVMERAS